MFLLLIAVLYWCLFSIEALDEWSAFISLTTCLPILLWFLIFPSLYYGPPCFDYDSGQLVIEPTFANWDWHSDRMEKLLALTEEGKQ